MGQLLDLGRRIELTSMDRHCHDISIGLYAPPADADGQEYVIHTYSHADGAAARIADLVGRMQVLGGMLPGRRAHSVRFPCGAAHRTAVKRVFVEACKLAPDAEAAAAPLRTFDKKAETDVIGESLGRGRYRFAMAAGEPRRATVAASGLAKLADLAAGAEPTELCFECGQAHDALVGLLLPRALNVRAALREYEAAAQRGVLAAPSQQAGGGSPF